MKRQCWILDKEMEAYRAGKGGGKADGAKGDGKGGKGNKGGKGGGGYQPKGGYGG